MRAPPEALRLDDLEGLERDDPSSMLRLVAGAGAQLREISVIAREAGLARLGEGGRPRAVVVAGVGGSGISGDVLAAIAGPACPVPIIVHRDYGLPIWVGAADVVMGVSSSGGTEETLSAVEQAVSRGCTVVGVGADDSPLAHLIARGNGPFVPIQPGRMPRVNLWALSLPLLLAGRALKILSIKDSDIAAAADRLDETAERCRPTSESFVNPAKRLAVELAGSVPMVWGTSPLGGVAAYRFAAQLAENAKYPSISGVLPEANHNQVVAFDGPFAGPASQDGDHLFRDRVDEPDAAHLRLVILRDSAEHPQIARRREGSVELARARGIEVTELLAEGTSPLERLAGLVALPDFGSVYLGLLYGIDPTPIAAIAELRERIAR